jgi:hypothetical protein
MNSILEQLLEGGGDGPHIITMRMRKFIGKTIFTSHASETYFYEVHGCTYLPISELSVHTESMQRFYERKHGIILRHTDLPAFICKGGNLVPPELSFYIEEPTI